MTKSRKPENPNFSTLLQEILEAGKTAGMTHSEMARRVGIEPETLSRIKARSNADFDILDKLARLVGKRLILVADDSAQAAIRRGEFF